MDRKTVTLIVKTLASQPATTILPRSMDYIKGLYAVGQSVYNAAVDHIFYGETSS